MPFCTQCGHEMPSNAKFCPECGSPVEAASASEQISIHTQTQESKGNRETWGGSIKKCPRCGEPLAAFSTTCHSCGFELRESGVSSSVSALSEKLQQMSMQIHDSSLRGILGAIKSSIVQEDDPRTDLIRSFPIPNTKEDLIEFIILAASNINPDAFNSGKSANLTSSEKSLSRAWLSKLDQAYQKASISLKNDPDFETITQLYDSTKEKVRKAELGMMRFFVK